MAAAGLGPGRDTVKPGRCCRLGLAGAVALPIWTGGRQQRFRAKGIPVRVKKTRQKQKLLPLHPAFIQRRPDWLDPTRYSPAHARAEENAVHPHTAPRRERAATLYALCPTVFAY